MAEAIEKPPYHVPPYPCVIFLARTNHIRYDLPKNREEGGDQRSGLPEPELEYLFHRLQNYDDMQHVDYCRKHKGFAVHAYHNFDFRNPHPDMVDQTTGRIKEDFIQMKRELDGLIISPEMRFAAEARAKLEAAQSEKEALDERNKRARRGSGES